MMPSSQWTVTMTKTYFTHHVLCSRFTWKEERILPQGLIFIKNVKRQQHEHLCSSLVRGKELYLST